MKLFVLSPEYLYSDGLGYLTHIFKSLRIKVVDVAIYQLGTKKKYLLLKGLRGLCKKLLKGGMNYVTRAIGIKIYYRFVSKVHATEKVSAESYFKEKGIPILITPRRYSEEVIKRRAVPPPLYLSYTFPMDNLFRAGELQEIQMVLAQKIILIDVAKGEVA